MYKLVRFSGYSKLVEILTIDVEQAILGNRAKAVLKGNHPAMKVKGWQKSNTLNDMHTNNTSIIFQHLNMSTEISGD